MEKIVFDAGWIKVKQTPKGYYFSERKGVDSIAVLLYKMVKWDNFDGDGIDMHILTRMQALPIDNAQSNDDKDIPKLFRCPITGGLEEGVSLINQARAEVREEAGYDIAEAAFHYIGEYYVGTQTNEKVHMFIANVDAVGTETLDIKGDGSYFESISKNEWINIEEVLDDDDSIYSGLYIAANKLYKLWDSGELVELNEI
jgi:hypothetical protein